MRGKYSGEICNDRVSYFIIVISERCLFTNMKIRLLLLFLFPFSYLHAQEQISLLFISSYDSSFPTFDLHYHGINDTFRERNIAVNIHMESLDSKRFPFEDMKKQLYQSLKYKISQSVTYDYVITADDNALRFALEYEQELFPGTPVVFFGVNNRDLALAQNSNPSVTGFLETISFPETLAIIRKLLPQAGKLYILYDETSSGSGDYQTIKRYHEPPGDDFSLEFLSLGNLSFEELYEILEKLERNEPVLLLSAFRDKTGKTLGFYESVRNISDHSAAPVFHMWGHGIGQGLVGGMVVDHYHYAMLSAQIVLDLIEGVPVGGYKVSEKPVNNRYLFDKNAMKQYDLKPRLLPRGTVFINDNPLFTKESLLILAGLVLLLLMLTGFIFDILKKNRIIKQTEKKYKALFSENRVPIIISDPLTGDILSYNNAAEEAYAVSLHKTLQGMVLDGKPTLNTGIRESLYTVMSIQDRIHQIRSVEVFSNTFESGGKHYQINMIHDISEKEGLVKQLNRAVKMEAIGKVASSFAHDFNNYLQGIMGYIELVLQSCREEDKKSREYLKKSLDLAVASKELAGRLLSISRDQNKEMEPLNITGLLRDVVDFLSHSVKKTVTVVLNSSGADLYVKGSSSDLQNALINLGLNGADAIAGTGSVEFRLKGNPLSQKVVIEVIDTGKGISPGDLDRIFDPFFTTKPEGEGTGLGLPTVYQIIENHRGTIKVTSTEGKGTTFRIVLPVMNSADF